MAQPSRIYQIQQTGSPNSEECPNHVPTEISTIAPIHLPAFNLPCLNCAIIMASDQLIVQPTELCNVQSEHPCTLCFESGLVCFKSLDSQSQHLLAHLLYAHSATGEPLTTPKGGLLRRADVGRVNLWIEACRLFVVCRSHYANTF
jgi:hypothetical protein